MTSFYVPCVVIVLLYWRIFRVIHRRSTAARQRTQQRPAQPADIYVVDNHANNTNVLMTDHVEVAESVLVEQCSAVTEFHHHHHHHRQSETAVPTEPCLVASDSSSQQRRAAAAVATGNQQHIQHVPSTHTQNSSALKNTQQTTGRAHTETGRGTRRGTSRGRERGIRGVSELANDVTASKCQSRQRSRRERKATKTLAIVLGK